MQNANHRPDRPLGQIDAIASTSSPSVSVETNRCPAQSRLSPPVLWMHLSRIVRWVAACSVAFILLVSLPATSFAQQTSIGFVDIPYLIDKAPQAADAELRLETEFAPRQLDLEVQRDRLKEIKLRLKLEALELSELDRGNLEREARGLERRLKRDELDFREELNIQKNNEFRKVRILVLEAIARFGKANDYDLIVSDGVLYADKSIDVTEKILEQLVKSNRALQSSN